MTQPVPAPDTLGGRLDGRVALVTGASRRRGIGVAVARRLLGLGATVAVHRWTQHDAEIHHDANDVEDVLAELRATAPGARVEAFETDLAQADAAARLVTAVTARLGHLDILVCNQAYSGHRESLRTLTPEGLDLHWRINARATLLLTQAFAAQHDGRTGGRVVWMTSGQQLGPMSDELAYATSKAALAGATASAAAELADAGIGLNTVNPGPVNTGYLDDAPPELLDAFPTGAPGAPDDPARLVAWLVGDEGRWVVGQVLSTEGGFRR